MSCLSCRTRVKSRKLRSVLMESILDPESEVAFHTAPWCLYLIPSVLNPYLSLSRKLAAPFFGVDILVKSSCDRQSTPLFISWKSWFFWLFIYFITKLLQQQNSSLTINLRMWPITISSFWLLNSWSCCYNIPINWAHKDFKEVSISYHISEHNKNYSFKNIITCLWI